MSKTPFFSVLIPTKNRHDLIQKAISSVLNQSFTDYELIIIDNNISNETENVVRKIDNEKIKYFRTGNLNMPDNWEYAFAKSAGEYITVLTDRMFYVSENVLYQIYQAIQKYKRSVVTWRWSRYDEEKDEIIGYTNNGIIKELNSKDILDEFLNGGDKRHWFNVTAPKGLNSCISRELYQDTIGNLSKLFYPISPDFTSCFILLYKEEKLIHLEDGLVVSGGHKYSNGIDSVMNKEGVLNYIEDLGVERNTTYNFTPVKAISVFNSMFNDLFFVSEMLNWGLTWDMVNKVEYYTLVYGEIKNNLYQNDKETDLAKWNLALNKESMKIQKLVKAKIKSDQKKINVNPFYLKIFKKIYKRSKRFLNSRISVI